MRLVHDELHVEVDVRTPRAFTALLNGGRGLARGYAEGRWDTDDLVSLIRICSRRMRPLDELRRRIAPLQRGLPHNTRIAARRNARAHYDLGNAMFELFLDDSLTYSAAIFDRPGISLEQAQFEKLDRACRRIGLRADHSLLEIGTGWGSLAMHAAAHYGCEVTTTTLATEQHALASRLARERGLDIDFLMSDYRELCGSYDRLISLEMVEAVGWRHLDEYFSCCSHLLRQDGAMTLQAILLEDRLYEGEKRARTFANTVVFPGGCLPSMAVIQDSVSRVTDFEVAEVEDMTASYAETLSRWRRSFLAGRDQVRSLGYDEEFIRTWDFYLAFSEAGFRERRLRCAQIVLAKPEWEAPSALEEAARWQIQEESRAA